MKDVTWKTALWDTSWKELHEGEFSEEGVCKFKFSEGATLDIPFGDISRRRILETTGIYSIGIEAKRYDYLFGITQDGIRLVLCDALSMGVGDSIPGSTCETFECSTILASRKEFDPSAPYLSIQFEIGLLREWIGLRCLPGRGGSVYSFDLGNGQLTIPLYCSLSKCVEIRFGIHEPKDTPRGVLIPYYCYINIEYARGRSLDDIWSTDLWKLQSLFAFCFGVYPEIKSARVRQGRDANWIDVYRSSANTRQNAKLPSSPPISFSQLKMEGLHDMATRWFELSGDEQRAVEMLTSLLSSWNMPLDLLLLSATTMLESLIRADRDPLYSKEELGCIIDPIVAMVDESVRQRVKGLLSQLGRPSYNQLLEEGYDNSRPWSERLIPDWSRFKKEQYALRIGGAHGISPHEHPSIRADHYYGQITLAYYLVMRRLGLSSKLIDCFEQSSFLNVARWELSKRYLKV